MTLPKENTPLVRAEMSFLQELSNNENPLSFASHLRQKRFSFFRSLADSLPRPLRILDVGGTEEFWLHMGFADSSTEIVLANVYPLNPTRPNFREVLADARDLHLFKDQEFDIVHSNSVIEHLPTLSDQEQMAKEIMRVGKRYFVQTPNYYFPLEPHFLFPGFQFLPLKLRGMLVNRFNLVWVARVADPKKAEEVAGSVRLLKREELNRLFPGATIYTERFLGLAKSFIAYGGW